MTQHPNDHRSFARRSISLVASAVALASVIAAPTSSAAPEPAGSDQRRPAQVVYSTDARGDVSTGAKRVDAPGTDVNRVIVNRARPMALVIKTRFADMVQRATAYRNVHIYYLRTPRTTYTIQSNITNNRNENQCTRAGGNQRICPSVKWRLNPINNTHVLRVPWRVLGEPRWVRLRGSVSGRQGFDVLAYRGPESPFNLPFGPRFYR